VRRSGSFPAILAIASTMAVAAAIAPAVPAAAASPAAFYAFGTNQRGEFGNGTTSSAANVSPTPASVPGTISQLTTGMRDSGALLADGTVWTWGENRYSQLGYNTGGAVVTTPRQVPGLSGITQLAMSDEGNGYAVGAGGNVWAWGDNSHGQLGNGSGPRRARP
jgi:alpha-tubulin suppressor-like RCC1 family protein